MRLKKQNWYVFEKSNTFSLILQQIYYNLFNKNFQIPIRPDIQIRTFLIGN